MLKPTGRKRKPVFIGWLYAETADNFTVNIPEYYKRKYKENLAIYRPGGMYQFAKNGTMFVQDG
jgi:hypothetical protein